MKRGAKGFTGGMPGHIKLLSKNNSFKSEERLRECTIPPFPSQC